jgi:hypothetical protein
VGWVKGGQLGSVYKQPETGEDGPDTAGGCQVSRKGHNGGAKGNAPCIYINVMYVQWNDWELNDASYRVYDNNNQNECC